MREPITRLMKAGSGKTLGLKQATAHAGMYIRHTLHGRGGYITNYVKSWLILVL